MAVVAQPLPPALVIRTGMLDEPPEVPGMVEAAQMHQLMDQDIVADFIRHEDKTPVEADVPRGGA